MLRQAGSIQRRGKERMRWRAIPASPAGAWVRCEGSRRGRNGDDDKEPRTSVAKSFRFFFYRAGV